jgi:protein TonB
MNRLLVPNTVVYRRMPGELVLREVDRERPQQSAAKDLSPFRGLLALSFAVHSLLILVLILLKPLAMSGGGGTDGAISVELVSDDEQSEGQSGSGGTSGGHSGATQDKADTKGSAKSQDSRKGASNSSTEASKPSTSGEASKPTTEASKPTTEASKPTKEASKSSAEASKSSAEPNKAAGTTKAAEVPKKAVDPAQTPPDPTKESANTKVTTKAAEAKAADDAESVSFADMAKPSQMPASQASEQPPTPASSPSKPSSSPTKPAGEPPPAPASSPSKPSPTPAHPAGEPPPAAASLAPEPTDNDKSGPVRPPPEPKQAKIAERVTKPSQPDVSEKTEKTNGGANKTSKRKGQKSSTEVAESTRSKTAEHDSEPTSSTSNSNWDVAVSLPFFMAPEVMKPAEAPVSGEGDSNEVDYKGVVYGKLEHAKVYPESARGRRAQGQVIIAFSIGDEGQVQDLKMVQSSGEADLDAEALAMVQRVSPFPPPKPNAQRFFQPAIIFGLDE